MRVQTILDNSVAGDAAITNLTSTRTLVVPATTRSLRLNLAGTRAAGNLDCVMDELVLKVNPASAGWSSNLFVNGDFEAAPGAEWTYTAGGPWARATYQAIGWTVRHYPASQVGSNYFCWGSSNQVNIAAYQDVDLTSYAASIDAGTCLCWFEGWFGSFQASNDVWTTMNIEFRSSHPGGSVVSTHSFLPYPNFFYTSSMMKLGFFLETVSYSGQLIWQNEQYVYFDEAEIATRSVVV